MDWGWIKFFRNKWNGIFKFTLCTAHIGSSVSEFVNSIEQLFDCTVSKLYNSLSRPYNSRSLTLRNPIIKSFLFSAFLIFSVCSSRSVRIERKLYVGHCWVLMATNPSHFLDRNHKFTHVQLIIRKSIKLSNINLFTALYFTVFFFFYHWTQKKNRERVSSLAFFCFEK